MCLRKIMFQECSNAGKSFSGSFHEFTVGKPFHGDAIEAIFIGMKIIKTELKADVLCDQHKRGDADGKPQYVDGREYFTAAQLAIGEFEIVDEHTFRVRMRDNDVNR